MPIHGALRTIGQRGEDGHQYTIFSNSASTVDRVHSDRMGASQRLPIAIHEVGGRVVGHNNTITIQWTPAHQVEGSETVDTWVKAASEGRPQEDEPAYRRETSIPHMTMEVKERLRNWIAGHVRHGAAGGTNYRGAAIFAPNYDGRGRQWQDTTTSSPAGMQAPACTYATILISLQATSAGGAGAVRVSPSSIYC